MALQASPNFYDFLDKGNYGKCELRVLIYLMTLTFATVDFIEKRIEEFTTMRPAAQQLSSMSAVSSFLVKKVDHI